MFKMTNLAPINSEPPAVLRPDNADLRFEFLFALNCDVGEIISLGPCPLGERRVVYITGGTFEGPSMRGEVVGGADWQILRSDGVLDLDARYAVREEGGGLIQVISKGYRYGPPEVMDRLARGEDVEAGSYYFRSTMRFETGAPNLAWLNRTIAVATAERRARRVDLEVWRLL